MTKSKKINGSMNLLKVFAILNIIGGHYYSHGAGLSKSGIINSIVYCTGICGLGDVGATVFALITGWFIIDSTFSFKKWMKYLGEVVFYSYLALLLMISLKLETYNFKNIIYSLFPISSALNWYAGTFCIAYLFLPLVKLACIEMQKRKDLYNYAIIIGLFAFFVLGSFTPVNHIVSTLSWMLYLFLLGSYVRWLCDQNLKIIDKFKSFSGLILLILLIISAILRYLIKIKYSNREIAGMFGTCTLGRYSITTLLISVSSLIYFSKLCISNKCINWFSKGTFGVYLIHDNLVLYPLIWFKLLKTNNYVESEMQFVHYFVSILIIFIIGNIFDSLRRGTLEKIWLKIIERIISLNKSRKIIQLIENLS